MHVAEPPRRLKFLAWPPHIEQRSIRPKQISDVPIVCGFGEVGHVERRLPCKMNSDLLVMKALFIFREGRRYTILLFRKSAYLDAEGVLTLTLS